MALQNDQQYEPWADNETSLSRSVGDNLPNESNSAIFELGPLECGSLGLETKLLEKSVTKMNTIQ